MQVDISCQSKALLSFVLLILGIFFSILLLCHGFRLSLFNRTAFTEKHAVEMFNNIGSVFQEAYI